MVEYILTIVYRCHREFDSIVDESYAKELIDNVAVYLEENFKVFNSDLALKA